MKIYKNKEYGGWNLIAYSKHYKKEMTLNTRTLFKLLYIYVFYWILNINGKLKITKIKLKYRFLKFL